MCEAKVFKVVTRCGVREYSVLCEGVRYVRPKYSNESLYEDVRRTAGRCTVCVTCIWYM